MSYFFHWLYSIRIHPPDSRRLRKLQKLFLRNFNGLLDSFEGYTRNLIYPRVLFQTEQVPLCPIVSHVPRSSMPPNPSGPSGSLVPSPRLP